MPFGRGVGGLPIAPGPPKRGRVGLAIVAGVVVLVWALLWRGAEVFALSFRDGEGRLVRGRAPTSLRLAFVDALRAMKVRRATVRVVRAERGARLVASGLDDFQAQRLRNILQLFPTGQLRSGEAPRQNRLLRLLGVTALLWLFGRADE